MLAGEGFGPQMSEGTNDALFASLAVDDNCVTDEKSLNAWLKDLIHSRSSQFGMEMSTLKLATLHFKSETGNFILPDDHSHNAHAHHVQGHG